MTTFANVNVGAAPNDGTGNSLRQSFITLNNNFSYINQTIWPDISQADLRANIVSSYISRFNLLQAATVDSRSIGNVGSAYYGNTYTVFDSLQGQLGKYGGNAAIVSTLSATGNVSVANLSVNGSITATSLNGAAIGNTSASTGAFTTITTTGNITLGNLSTIGVNTSTGVNSIINIDGLGWIRQKIMNGINVPGGISSPQVIYLWNTPSSASTGISDIGSNLTLVMDSTIVGGYFKNIVLRNKTANIIYVTLPNTVPVTNNNLGTNVFAVNSNTTAFLTFRSVDTTAANVFIQVTKN
jgi:hypothetical protein